MSTSHCNNASYFRGVIEEALPQKLKGDGQPLLPEAMIHKIAAWIKAGSAVYVKPLRNTVYLHAKQARAPMLFHL